MSEAYLNIMQPSSANYRYCTNHPLLIHLHELCGRKRCFFLISGKANYSIMLKSCLKWKFGTAVESFPLPTRATSSLLFIKTLTQSEKYTDRIKKKGTGEKSLNKKEKKKDRREKENLLHVFFVLSVISLFKVQFVVQILPPSPGRTRGDKAPAGRSRSRSASCPVRSDWLKGFLVKHDIT